MSGFELTQTLASVATVVAVVLTWLQLIQVKKQARTTFEDRLNEQYRRIMEDIPADIWLGAKLEALGEEKRALCRDAIYRYIDLSNEEAFLYGKRRITSDTWVEWRKRVRVYWVYFVWGQGGWYAEIPEGRFPLTNKIALALPEIRLNPESLFSGVPQSSRKLIAGDLR